MFTPDQYQLLDFGLGRRLERFGGLVVDRPAPAVEDMPRADPAAWRAADARFERTRGDEGRWDFHRALPNEWTATHGRLVFALKPAPLGQVGLFPEQAENWAWIVREVERVRKALTPGPSPKGRGESDEALTPGPSPGSGRGEMIAVRVLNLFAYTGGSTLAAAAAGAEVVHVDAARNVVAWARRNADLSGLAAAPIRWIAEDAVKFVNREIRRGSRYDAVILDPPSYGHGAHGEVWRLAQHLPRLLELCGELTAGRRRFMLLTCHTQEFGPSRLRRTVVESLGGDLSGKLTTRELTLPAPDGREFPAGTVVRWQRGAEGT